MSKYVHDFFAFFQHLFVNRHLIFTLVKDDFKKQYLGSYLGLVWAFVQPLTFILVIWFVFTYGFRTAPVTGDTPYFLWLVTGMIPWFFIANSLLEGANAITNNSFLVKRVSFRVSILPLVPIGSALIIHVVLVLFLVSMFLLYGYTPSIYWIQLPYFLFCSIVLVLGISWITASVKVFVKDIGNILNVLIQVGFWATPILWSADMITPKYQWLLKLNPAFYIVEGFRDTFIYHRWFFESGGATFYFLSLAGFLFICGAFVFRRLRPHFGDVL